MNFVIRTAFLVGLALALFCPPLVSPAAPAGDPERVFQTQFEGPQALRPWEMVGNGDVQLAPGYQGSQSLRVERSAAQGAGDITVRLRLPVERLRGARVDFRALIKADDVAKPPQFYNGVKFMLAAVGPDGTQYTAHENLSGTFDWKPLTFRAVVPEDATEAWLVLGLEATTGRAWFDNVQVTIDARSFAGPAVAPLGHAYTGHPGLPRLRGAMISPQVTADDLRVLGKQWHANVVRWQLFWVTPEGRYDGWRDPSAYNVWLGGALRHLDHLLPVCQEAGLRVVVDLHTPPGGNILVGDWPLFQEKAYQTQFLRVWQDIARRYRGNKVIWGYDLANEPIEGDVADGLMDWHALATRAAQEVRAIDPDHAIIVEPGPGGGWDNLKFFPPLPVRGVVYSVHMYAPGHFTHQGVLSGYPPGVHYPGVIDGVLWDKAQMEKSLRDVVRYQQHYHVSIYIGEFSAVRWAPDDSAYNYLRDAIAVFEKNGWDWTYHAFREWQGWSVEYDTDPKATAPSKSLTARETLLRAWYAKNVQPNGYKQGTRRAEAPPPPQPRRGFVFSIARHFNAGCGPSPAMHGRASS